MAWKITATKEGTYTAATGGKYVDRDIEFVVNGGSASVTGKTITKDPTITYDSTNKKIKATYSGSDTVTGSVTEGWVKAVDPATVSVTGTASIDAASLDNKLIAGNIKDGVEVLGVTGTLTGPDFGTTTAVRQGNKVTWGTGWIEAGTSTGSTTSRRAEDGSASATGEGIELGSVASSVPSSGKYITVKGSGSVSTGEGWVTNGSTASNEKTVYYPIETAGLKNAGDSGKTYTDISGSAPVLVSGDFLYINKGYFDTDSKVSLAKLVPDAATLVGTAADYLYKDYTAYDKDGTLITGTMNDASISASATGSATISNADFAYDSAHSRFNVTGSASITGTASATTTAAGFASGDTTGSGSTTGTANLSAAVAKVGLGTAKTSGELTVAPTLARTAKPSGDTWTDAASGAATTTKPTTGAYVQIDAAAATNTLKVKPIVSSEGYGDTTNYDFTEYSATVGAAKAATAYVPIKGATGSATGGAVDATGANVVLGTKTTSRPGTGRYITVSGGGNFNVSSAGWIDTGDHVGGEATAYYPINSSSITSETCTATASKVNAKATYSTSSEISDSAHYSNAGILTSAPTATGAVYITIAPTISTTNGVAKADATSSCTTSAGYTDGQTGVTATATQNTTAVGVDTTIGTTRYIEVFTGTYTVV